jgi:hypothetical protein
MRRFATYLGGLLVLTSTWLAGQTASPAVEYHIFAGNTHAHTAFTWSHGAHLATNGCAGILAFAKDPASQLEIWSDGYVKTGSGCPAIYVIDGSQIFAPGVTLKPDWQTFQGPPSAHFAAAKAAGYDFYAATDHSQEAAFQPPGPTNATWAAVKQQAAAASDDRFVGLAGFEYSENDGPGGTGHINVFNTADMRNALVPGADLPSFYTWLAEAKANGDGSVVASFNHPSPNQYDNWAHRDARVTDVITMLEVINSNNKIHYPGFINALDHGWKVAPVSGNDNHGLGGIVRQTSRTFVLATARTKAAILDAMKHRRTYASLDNNIQCRYTVNGAIMGSTLNRPGSFSFDITITDPDTSRPQDRITKIDIVKDGGKVVQTYEPTPAHAVHWTPTIDDAASKYFFVRVWTSGGGDAPDADAANPVAWLAPVWTGR